MLTRTLSLSFFRDGRRHGKARFVLYLRGFDPPNASYNRGDLLLRIGQFFLRTFFQMTFKTIMAVSKGAQISPFSQLKRSGRHRVARHSALRKSSARLPRRKQAIVISCGTPKHRAPILGSGSYIDNNKTVAMIMITCERCCLWRGGFLDLLLLSDLSTLSRGFTLALPWCRTIDTVQ